MSQDDVDRYLAALHAMQTGVAIEQARGSRDGEPKHLRVGVNTAMVDHAGLAQLLISKGLITEDEYTAAIADAMEAEVARYEQRIQEQVGHSGVRLR